MAGRTHRGKGARVIAAGLAAAAAFGAAAAEDLDIRDYEAPDACDAALPQVRITVVGIETSEGILAVDLYGDDPDVFLKKEGRLRRVRVPAAAPGVTVCMAAGPGDYAVSTYHDEDGDRDLDKKWNKMPKEPFGLSNDPKLKFGWPKIEPSLFPVGEAGADVTINLRRAD